MTEWYHNKDGGRKVFLEVCDNIDKCRLVHYDPDGIKYDVAIQKILKVIKQFVFVEE